MSTAGRRRYSSPALRSVMATCISRAGWSTGRSRRMPRVIEYIVVVDPMPRARARVARRETPGLLLSIRSPSRRSLIGNRESGIGNRESGIEDLGLPLYAREASRGFSDSRFPIPYSRLSDRLFPRKIVQRQPPQRVKRHPVPPQCVDVRAERAVTLTLGNVEVVDLDLAHEIAVLRHVEALDCDRIGLRRQGEVSGGERELHGGEVGILGRRVPTGACTRVGAILVRFGCFHLRLAIAPLHDRHLDAHAVLLTLCKIAVGVVEHRRLLVETDRRSHGRTKAVVELRLGERTLRLHRLQLVARDQALVLERLLDRERGIDVRKWHVGWWRNLERRVRREAEQPLERCGGSIDVELCGIRLRARLEQGELTLQEIVLTDL